MLIKNQTRDIILAADAKDAVSIADKVLGLLKKSNPRFIILHTRFGIHTFFLKEPIDVVVLNKNCEVVALKERLRQNRIFLWNPKYNLVLEMPQNTIKKSKTRIGNKILFVN